MRGAATPFRVAVVCTVRLMLLEMPSGKLTLNVPSNVSSSKSEPVHPLDYPVHA